MEFFICFKTIYFLTNVGPLLQVCIAHLLVFTTLLFILNAITTPFVTRHSNSVSNHFTFPRVLIGLSLSGARQNVTF